MRSTISGLILCIIYFDVSAQVVAKEYHDYFGHKLSLNRDSSFMFTWSFDLAASWSVGTWNISNDTIYLNVIDVYDTLKKSNGDDTLVLSMDEKSNRIDHHEFVMSILSGGGQSRDVAPSKLYYRARKLYLIDKDGRLVRNKVYGILRGKKYPPWYKVV